MAETLKQYGAGPGILILAGAIATGILVIDLTLPLGVAEGVLYVAPLLIVTFAKNPKSILYFAGLASLLIIIGHRYSPDGGVAWMVFANRGISLFAVWAVAAVAFKGKLADHEHLKSEARYRDLIEGSVLPIQITTDDRAFLYVNKAYLDLFGYESVEEVFEYRGKAIAPHHRNFIFQLGAARKRGESVPEIYEHDIVRKDGSYVPVQAHTRRLLWEGRMASQRVLVDLSMQKDAENEILELNRTLEQRVEERSRDLQKVQQELLKKERLATLGQLAATVSHELRNPLGVINNSTYVLRKLLTSSDDRLVRAVERIDRNIIRSTAIIEELSDYTRMPDREFTPTDLKGWLNGILDGLPVPEGITVIRRFEDEERLVSMDPDYLRRAIINLYDNACQAMLEQRPETEDTADRILTISVRLSGERIGISFRDTGPGIAEAVRDKIFEPLYSTKSFGVGLGLCIVKQIMEQHDGEIEILSSEGQGAEMILWLPGDRIACVA